MRNSIPIFLFGRSLYFIYNLSLFIKAFGGSIHNNVMGNAYRSLFYRSGIFIRHKVNTYHYLVRIRLFMRS